jgi:choline dehydrogenase-like flavoprotein
VHPGLLGIALPWRCGLSFKACTLLYRHVSVFIAISRDRSCADNRVVLSAEGEPVVRYQVQPTDAEQLLAGQEAMLRMMHAAGASVIAAGDESGDWYARPDRDSDRDREGKEAINEKARADATTAAGAGAVGDGSDVDADVDAVEFAAYLRYVRARGVRPNRSIVMSAHQMGSCRMAADPREVGQSVRQD